MFACNFCDYQEKGALKKLDNVRKDHEKRIEGLQKEQVLPHPNFVFTFYTEFFRIFE